MSKHPTASASGSASGRPSLRLLAALGIAGLAVAISNPDASVLARQGDAAAHDAASQANPVTVLVNETLNISESTLVTLTLDLTPAVPLTAVVPLDGLDYTLDLVPHDLRADGYELLIQLDDGSIVPHETGPVRTLRGTVLEVPGSRVTATMTEDGLHAAVRMPDEEGRYLVEPVPASLAGLTDGNHVVYRSEHMLGGGTCGNLDFAEGLDFADGLDIDVEDLDGNGDGNGGGGVAGGEECYWFTEIAFDADWEYFDGPGNNSVLTTELNILTIINDVAQQYEDDVQISYLVTGILVRTTSNDPYTSGTIGGLLDQFRSVWNSTNPFPRDVAELFTGRDLSGDTIGIAYLQDICTSSAYSVVEHLAGSAGCRSDLSAHELGHNWSAAHCSCPGNTMNSGLTCANNFSQGSINSINSYRVSRQFCLDNLCVPENDNCDGAIDIFDGQFSFATTEVTDTDGPPDSACGAETLIYHDIWYRYFAPCDGQVTVDLCSSAFDTKLAVYESGCPLGANNAIACDDDSSCGSTSIVTFNVLENTQYFIRVGGPEGVFGNGLLDLDAPLCIPEPANDDCGSAGPLFEGVTAFTTFGATTDGPDEGATCDTGSGGQLDNDVWYRYVAGCNGEATISLCDANFDTKIAVYAAFCPSGGGSVLACNDDACGTQSTVTFPVSAGTIYRVRVGGANGETGSGNLDVSCGPAGDPCTGDTNGDNVVDVLDLVNVILDWGSNGSANGGDVNGDLIVNVNDLLDVILGWGACP